MLVIADDLTGAADTAGAFAASGHRCVVVLHGNRPSSLPTDTLPINETDTDAIIVVDTDTRAMREAEARRVTADVVGHLGPAELFIKIDSTLRGHVRATVEAALSAMTIPPARIVVCPAFPDHGRSIVDGRVQVHGAVIDAPSLREMFADLADMPMVYVPDARTDDDLADIVATSTTATEAAVSTLWVGSAGLARHLGARGSVSNPDSSRPAAARRVIVVAGSQHGRTAEQLDHLDPGTEAIVLDPRNAAFRDRVKEAIREVDGFVLTGGATARVVLELLHVDTLHVGGEVEPGVPWSTAVGRFGSIGVVTKAGGFGDALTLQRAVRFLRRPE